VVDHPNERSLHTVPTPRTGGIAIVCGLLVGYLATLLWAAIGPMDAGTRRVLGDISAADSAGCIAGALGLALASFCSDRRELSPVARLGAHLAAAAAVVWLGVSIERLSFPVVGDVPLGWMSGPFTIVYIVWMCNLYNFMDGIDGLAAGMAVVGFGFLSALSRGDGSGVSVLAAVTAAAAAGFLVHNYPPATIFMGDTGSVPLGFLAAVLSILASRRNGVDMVASWLVFSPFILDATVVLARRAIRGTPVWKAHREHYYQRIVVAGWSRRRVLLTEFALMAVCGCAAFGYVAGNATGRILVLCTLTCVYWFLAYVIRTAERRQAPYRERVNVGPR
jgi:UDP-N-acetylmuramyl pentapeptide phosphotransferase/UDP-N-acetylglucosamine-1-phosphate transferase